MDGQHDADRRVMTLKYFISQTEIRTGTGIQSETVGMEAANQTGAGGPAAAETENHL